MKIALFGATGGTGLAVIKQGLAAGHQFTVLARNPAVLAEFKDNANVSIVQGDALNQPDVEKVIAGQDSVIVSLGGRPNAPQVCSQAQPLINQAVLKSGRVKRVIAITSLGCGESYQESGFMIRILVNTLLKRAIADKNIQEEVIRKDFPKDGPTSWTIVRPGGLLNGPVTGKYKAQAHGISGGRINREDVAHFIVNQCLDPEKAKQYDNESISLAS